MNQVLGIVRRKGRSRKVGLALVLMVLLGGRASVRNAAETFGLDYANLLEALGELHDAWRDYLEVPSGLLKGEVAIIIDDTVDHKEYSRGKDVSPHGNYWIYRHTHWRFERGVQLLMVAIVDLSTGRTFMVGAFPYAVRKMLDLGMVTEFKTKIDLAREMLDVLKGYFRVSRVVFDSWYWSEKLVTDNVVSELQSNRRPLRVESIQGTLEEVEGHLRVGDLPPGVYYADLTLGGQTITVNCSSGNINVTPGHTSGSSTRPTSRSARRRSRSSTGTSSPWDWRTPRSGGGRGFRATSRSSPS